MTGVLTANRGTLERFRLELLACVFGHWRAHWRAIRGLQTEEDNDAGLKLGDIVTVNKPGKQIGQKAIVVHTDWHGLVKVDMLSGSGKGSTKSYERKMLIKEEQEAEEDKPS